MVVGGEQTADKCTGHLNRFCAVMNGLIIITTIDYNSVKAIGRALHIEFGFNPAFPTIVALHVGF